jgi:TRAP-type C4-dicarboxylate transport system permease small subunit
MKAFKALIIKALNAVHIALVWIACALILGMVVIIATNVFLRFAFNTGILWSEEIALLFIVWFVFISFGLGVRQRLHITLSILPRGKIPAWLDATLDIAGEIIMLIVGAVMVIYGNTLVGFTMRSIMPATGLPAGMMYLALPFAGVSIVVESLLHLLRWDGNDAALDAFLSGEGKASDVFGGTNA